MSSFLNHVADAKVRNTVGLAKFSGEVGFADNWWTTDEDFEGEEATEVVEFEVEVWHWFSCDAVAAVPVSVEEFR